VAKIEFLKRIFEQILTLVRYCCIIQISAIFYLPLKILPIIILCVIKMFVVLCIITIDHAKEDDVSGACCM